MFIIFTEKEINTMQNIRDKYTPQLDEMHEQLEKLRKTPGTEEQRSVLLVDFQRLLDRQMEEIDAEIDKAQRRVFKTVEEGGIEKILADAKEQAPQLLEHVYAERVRDNEKGLVTSKIGTVKKGKFLLNSYYALEHLNDELYLHIEALRDNKDALQELLEVIRETVVSSKFTDRTKIPNVDDFLSLFHQQRKQLTPSIKNKRLPDIPEYHIMNDMTALNLVKYDADIDGQLTLMWEINDTKTEPVAVSLSYDNPNIAYTKKLTEFDKDIIDAVSTLFYYWERTPENKALPVCPPLIITPAHIWRTMNGKDINDHMARPSARQIQRICDSMDKLRTTLISIDYIKDLRESGFDIKPGMDRTRQSYMIKADKDIEKKNTGKNSIIYLVSEAPFLYRYNLLQKHVLFVDYKLLNITGIESKTKKNSTEYMQEFRGYLLRRITLMRRNILQNKHIRLDAIYTDTDIKEPARRIKREDYANEATYKKEIRAEKRRDCDTIRHILGEWINQDFIKGYTEDKEGRGGSVTGFCIDYDIDPVGEKAIAALEAKKTRKKTKKK